MLSIFEVSDYTRNSSDLISELTIKSGEEEFFISKITINNPDTIGQITVRGIGEEYLDGLIAVPYYDSQDVFISISNPDLSSTIAVKHIDELESVIEIKSREFLDAIIDVRNISELESIITVNQINEIDAEVIISQPDLFGFVYPRVEGINELSSVMMIRKRDVGDLNSIITVKGKGRRNYVFII
ncbi:hypothetical protein D3C74_320560 [compost metagenome]